MSQFTKREEIAKEIYFRTISYESTLRANAKPEEGQTSEYAVRRADELLLALETIPAADMDSKRAKFKEACEKLHKIYVASRDYANLLPEEKVLVNKSGIEVLEELFDELFPKSNG